MIATLLLLAACSGDGEGAGDVVVTDLGNIITDEDGFATVPFEVGEDSLSIGVYCGPYGFTTLATADDILDPGGKIIYDDDDPAHRPMRVNTSFDFLPFQIPVSPELNVEPGMYTLDLYVEVSDPATVPCSTVERRAAVSLPAVIDLDFVFVGVDDEDVAPGLNGPGGESMMNDVLGMVSDDWDDQIAIGDVTYNDFDGTEEELDKYKLIDDDTEFGELLRRTPDRRSLTIYVVQAIFTQGHAPVAGLAGGPPGVSTLGGTSKSGAVVSVADWLAEGGAGQARLARTISHEGGHFLGLFHTSERSGDEFDPLEDTEECKDAQGGNDACDSRGSENVMFWTGGESISRLTDDQGWVVQRSAAVH